MTSSPISDEKIERIAKPFGTTAEAAGKYLDWILSFTNATKMHFQVGETFLNTTITLKLLRAITNDGDLLNQVPNQGPRAVSFVTVFLEELVMGGKHPIEHAPGHSGSNKVYRLLDPEAFTPVEDEDHAETEIQGGFDDEDEAFDLGIDDDSENLEIPAMTRQICVHQHGKVLVDLTTLCYDILFGEYKKFKPDTVVDYEELMRALYDIFSEMKKRGFWDFTVPEYHLSEVFTDIFDYLAESSVYPLLKKHGEKDYYYESP